MNHSIRRIAEVASTAILLVFFGASAAFAGPAPIEPEFPPPASTPAEAATASDGFPWMLAGAIALLAVAVVGLSVVLWKRHRTHAVHRGLATP